VAKKASARPEQSKQKGSPRGLPSGFEGGWLLLVSSFLLDDFRLLAKMSDCARDVKAEQEFYEDVFRSFEPQFVIAMEASFEIDTNCS